MGLINDLMKRAAKTGGVYRPTFAVLTGREAGFIMLHCEVPRNAEWCLASSRPCVSTGHDGRRSASDRGQVTN